MGLRLTTAMTLVLAAGALAACDDSDETAVVEGDEVVIVEEDAAVVPDAEIADTDVAVIDDGEVAETDLVVDETVASDETIELDTDVTEVGEDTADASADLVVVETDEIAADAGTANLVETEESPAEETAEMTNEEVDAAQEAAAEAAAADGDAIPAEGLDTAGTDDGVIELTNNVTVADAPDALNASDGTADAEARVTPGASEETMVEETNDVGTDGIDSGSELTMTDFDNLVLDEAGVQRLTAFVEGSDAFTATQKITIVAGFDAARDDPERLGQLLEQVREIVAAAN